MDGRIQWTVASGGYTQTVWTADAVAEGDSPLLPCVRVRVCVCGSDPAWREEAKRWLANAWRYTLLFMDTHLREPVVAVVRELFHGTVPTIDPQQVIRVIRDLIRGLIRHLIST